MEEELKDCPICLKRHKILSGTRGDTYFCDNRKHASVIDDSVLECCTELEKQQRLNAIYNFIFDKPFYKEHYYWRFFYEETDKLPDEEKNINVFHLMKNYPFDIVTRVNKILLNLNKLYPRMSDSFTIMSLRDNNPRLFYPESLNAGYEKSVNEFVSIYSILSNQKFIELRSQVSGQPETKEYALTYTGLKRIDELKYENKTSNKIFIAMSFDPSVAYIEKAFKEGIIKAGFVPVIIKDKEHNNYIMPEIFYEIDNSAGVVVDITKQNNGAYFEAGFALGKNKEVIVCCNRDVFENPETKPHFDIAQKSLIIWDNERDLIDRLEKRIKSTIRR